LRLRGAEPVAGREAVAATRRIATNRPCVLRRSPRHSHRPRRGDAAEISGRLQVLSLTNAIRSTRCSRSRCMAYTIDSALTWTAYLSASVCHRPPL